MEQLQTFDGCTCGTSDLTDVLERLGKLARRDHTYCEDGWYSCPKAEDGCYNEGRGPECDCGADEHNAEVDALMALLRSNVELTGAGTASVLNAKLGAARPGED